MECATTTNSVSPPGLDLPTPATSLSIPSYPPSPLGHMRSSKGLGGTTQAFLSALSDGVLSQHVYTTRALALLVQRHNRIVPQVFKEHKKNTNIEINRNKGKNWVSSACQNDRPIFGSFPLGCLFSQTRANLQLKSHSS